MTRFHIHQLAGCSPTPLADYLKAIAVLRLVSQQADPDARGFWKDESFTLISRLSRNELLDFFLNRYQPTPIIAPWNGGSGFYPKDNQKGIESIARSTAERFSPFRRAIEAGRAVIDGRDKSPKEDEKFDLIAHCRRQWRGPLLDWLDAALVLTESGTPAYPALLGTGGNDGRLDFTNNFMQRLVELIDIEDANGRARLGAELLLEGSLFEKPVHDLQKLPIGQFDPGGAGGANGATGFSGAPRVNPWDFVLMLEGAVAFASGVVRRMANEELPQASAPFAVYHSPSGFASGVDGEKSRGEQWMPLWQRPLTFAEFESLIHEARCQLGKRPARQPLDMARAIARLGVARGISAFERFGYIERNGQANLATALGRWEVPKAPVPFQELLDEIEGWVDALRRKAGGKGAPAVIGRVARRCESAMMECCRDGRSAWRWRELLKRLGEAEAALIRSPGFTAGAGLQPLGAHTGGLSPDWLVAAGSDLAELRLALALASGHGTRTCNDKKSGRLRTTWDPAWPARAHFLPLEELPSNVRQPPRRFHTIGDALAHDPTVVCTTGDPYRDAIQLVRRRTIEAHRSLQTFFPLAPVPGAEATLTDLLAFIAGEVDGGEILALARPLMALDWARFQRQSDAIRDRLRVPEHRSEFEAADALGAFGLMRLCHHWNPIPLPVPATTGASERGESNTWIEHSVRLDASILARLTHGNLPAATQLAVRRLNASGLRPHITRSAGDSSEAMMIAAALAFPIGNREASRLARRLVRPSIDHHEPAPWQEEPTM